MDKNEVLSQLRAAKEAHVNWVQKAKMLIRGFTIDKDAIPVNSTECRFGKWFYSDAQKLNALQNNPLASMTNIEHLHFQLHDIYLNIFKIYYDTSEQGLFAKFFGLKQKVKESDKKLAAVYFDDMEKVSILLIEDINRMERRILAISDTEMDKIA